MKKVTVVAIVAFAAGLLLGLVLLAPNGVNEAEAQGGGPPAHGRGMAFRLIKTTDVEEDDKGRMVPVKGKTGKIILEMLDGKKVLVVVKPDVDPGVKRDGNTLIVPEDAIMDEPPTASDDAATTDANTPVIIDVAANDFDPEGNLDPTTTNTSCDFGSVGCTDPTGGKLVNNHDGTFLYTPDLGFSGTDTFVYEICDGLLSCDTAVASIEVT